MGSHQDVDVPVTAPVRRAVVIGVALVTVLTAVGLVWLWPDEQVKTNLTPELAPAVVTGVQECKTPASDCSQVTIQIEDGPASGESFKTNTTIAATSPDLPVGTPVWVSVGGPDQDQYGFFDIRRDKSLTWLAIIFAITVIVFARWKGLAALAGLASSLILLIWFVLPALLLGKNPVAVAAVGAAAIAIASMGFAHGVKVRTGVALIGTVVALILTLILGNLFTAFTSLTGLGSEDAYFLDLQGLNFDLKGLFLAGIVIGALGVLDDVTVTQAAAVSEVKHANPAANWTELFTSGMRVGRDHVAATVNTLVLAYVGASLPLFLLLAMADAPLLHALNGEAIAQEVVRALVGGMGIIAAVPITTALMALVLTESQPTPKPASDLAPEDTDPNEDFWAK